MSKIILNPLASLVNQPTALNVLDGNFSAIGTAFENTLSRDGTSPNQMLSYLDMNSKRILNLPAPTTATEPLRLQELEDFVGGSLVINNITNANINSFTDGMVNGTLVASAVGSVLTISLKTLAGLDPSALDPVYILFRNSTAATGNYTSLTVTAGVSITVSVGSTLGATNNVPFRIWIVGFNDAGTFRLGIINCTSTLQTFPLSEYQLRSSTAEGGAGAADSAGVIYTGVAVTTKPFRILGYMEWGSGLATAGTWASGPTLIQLYRSGIPRPGEIVQTINVLGASVVSAIAATSWTNTNLTVSITPTSTSNPVTVNWATTLQQTNQLKIAEASILKGGTPIGPVITLFTQSGGSLISPISGFVTDFPATLSAVVYTLGVQNDVAGGSINLPGAGGTAIIQAIETMG